MQRLAHYIIRSPVTVCLAWLPHLELFAFIEPVLSSVGSLVFMVLKQAIRAHYNTVESLGIVAHIDELLLGSALLDCLFSCDFPRLLGYYVL